MATRKATVKSPGRKPARRVTAGRAAGRRGSGRAVTPVDSLVEPALHEEVPQWMARSTIYQKLPPGERARLDRALLLPDSTPTSLDALAAEFKLAERYGISTATLKTYAGKLEQLVRPVVTSQVLAGVLGCLPAAYRRKLIQGSEVILVSKVLEALNSQQSQLSVPELTKMASILSALARRRSTPHRAGPRPRLADASADTPSPSPTEPTRLAESIRLLYGLPWPVDGTTSPAGVPVQS